MGGKLMRFDADAADGPSLTQLNREQLHQRLSEVADFVKVFEGRRGAQLVPTSPPQDVTSDVFRRGSWAFPPVRGVIEAPTFRDDGTLVEERGYDAATRLIHCPEPTLKVPEVPSTPDEEDVGRARDLLSELFCDFPFVDESSYANALGLLLTPIMRGAIGGPVPMALIDKPQRGTGASLIADVVSLVATGRSAPMTSPPTENAEWGKKVTALLKGAPTLIVFDNVEKKLTSGSLAAVLTAQIWSDRNLGHSEMLDLPNRATWVATGNNLDVGGDIQRRTYLIRLDAEQSRPFERGGFVHPELKDWVKTNRGELLWALLVLGRAWFVAKRPKGEARPLGSFEDWTRVIGGVLTNAGVSGFLGNAKELYAELDTDSQELEVFLQAIFEKKGSIWWKAADFTDVIDGKSGASGFLKEALPEQLAGKYGQDGFTTELGKYLSKHRRQRVGDDEIYVDVSTSTSGGTKQYRVVKGGGGGQTPSLAAPQVEEIV